MAIKKKHLKKSNKTLTYGELFQPYLMQQLIIHNFTKRNCPTFLGFKLQ